jgi:pimeloyl-ACP methyl ester carboxylesterase
MTDKALLNYSRSGSGYPLVMQHGYFGSSELWRAQIDYFADFYDVITPDLAGFGASAALQAPDTIPECANRIFELLDSLGIDEFMLMGHSMGGMIVQQMALMQPARIARLVCFGTGPVGLLPDRFESLDESRQRIQSEGLQAAARRIARTWFIDGASAPGYAVCERVAQQASEQAALACLRAWEEWNVEDQLGNISMPCLVVWGDHDRSYGWRQPQSLWRNIPDANLAVLPGCAHNAHMEKPHLFNLVVHDFLRAHEALTGKLIKC